LFVALQGPLQGHAEHPLHKRLSSSKSFDPTRSGKLSDPDEGAASNGGKAAGDVEMGECQIN
jgi:hypothetical protein